jgi:hypothetical protein
MRWRYDVTMIMLMTIKKVAREPKSRNDPRKSGPKKKRQKWSPDGRRETAERKGHKERLWRDRVRQNLRDGFFYKNELHGTGNGTSSASVAMCEAFSDTCAAYPREWPIPRVGLMKAGTCERSECVRASQKSGGFFWCGVSWRHTGQWIKHTRP